MIPNPKSPNPDPNPKKPNQALFYQINNVTQGVFLVIKLNPPVTLIIIYLRCHFYHPLEILTFGCNILGRNSTYLSTIIIYYRRRIWFWNWNPILLHLISILKILKTQLRTCSSSYVEAMARANENIVAFSSTHKKRTFGWPPTLFP